MTLRLHATPEEVMRAVEALRELSRATQVPEGAAFSLALALEECGSNIVNHALQRDARRTFQVALENAGDTFFIELRDDGPEFDPTRQAENARAREDTPGGWGLQLVRRHVDEMRYTRQGGENVLRLRKRLSTGADRSSSTEPR